MTLDTRLTERPALHIGSRIAAALLGGWTFTWGFTTLGIAGAVALGMRYGEARTLLYLLAFLVFLAAFLWSFATKRITQVWLVLAGGGGAMTGAAWWLTRSLVST